MEFRNIFPDQVEQHGMLVGLGFEGYEPDKL
jgi:hypothetical protein